MGLHGGVGGGGVCVCMCVCMCERLCIRGNYIFVHPSYLSQMEEQKMGVL